MIVDFRQAIFKLLEHPVQDAGWACTQFLPDDVSLLPCVSVGRVRVTFVGTQLGVESQLTVFVIGSRLTSDDAQADLDEVAEQVTSWLLQADQAVLTAEPTVTTINALPHPTYEITILDGHTIC